MAEQLLSRLENAVARLEKLSGSLPQSAVQDETDPQWIGNFETEYLQSVVAQFQTTAKATGVAEIVQTSEIFVQFNQLLLELLRKSQRTSKPTSPTEVQQFLVPVTALSQKLSPDNRSEFFAHQKAVAETMSAALLLTVPAPAVHLQAVLEAADFHLIKVLRKKVDAETAWAKQLKVCLQWLISWASENFKLGLIWNTKPNSPTPVTGKAKAPGPPPPPAAAAAVAAAPTAATAGGFGDVMKQLESGNFSLKKTEKKTGPTENSGPGPMDVEKGVSVKRPFVSSRKGEPRFLLERDCWYIENHWDAKEAIAVKEPTMKQSVYVGKCGNCTVAISGKIKTITIDGCEGINVVAESVISTIEIVNCRKINLQITGNVPSVSIDKTDGVQIYLSPASVGVDLTTAKCSEINVNIPAGETGDWKELVIPEQFVHKIQNNKVVSRVSDLYG